MDELRSGHCNAEYIQLRLFLGGEGAAVVAQPIRARPDQIGIRRRRAQRADTCACCLLGTNSGEDVCHHDAIGRKRTCPCDVRFGMRLAGVISLKVMMVEELPPGGTNPNFSQGECRM